MPYRFLLLFILIFINFSSQEQPFTVSQDVLSNPSDPTRTLQSCQLGCLDCSSPEKCLTCDSETTLKGDICLCNQAGKYYEVGSGCTGDCIEGCDKCIDSQTCLQCSSTRISTDRKCKCESPRVLIGTNCECPSYMIENPTTMNCEYIDQIDVIYQSTISPLFDAVLQAQINPMMKYQLSPIMLWSGDCTFQNDGTRARFKAFLLTQVTDVLLIPSTLLEFNLQCDITVSYINENSLEISKQIFFQTLKSITAAKNFILAEVSSKTGSQISSSSLKVTWTQIKGDDLLDMTKLYNPSSNPLKLNIPKCTLSQGKLYTFRISVRVGTLMTSQEITIGIYSPKIQLQPIQTNSYHIYSDDLILTASQLSLSDECNQGILPSDFLDLSTVLYTWEYVSVDLTNDRLLFTELAEITDDPNISVPSDPLNLFYHSTNTPTLTIPDSYFTLLKNSQLIFYLTVTMQSISPSMTNLNLLQPTTLSITTKAYVKIVTSKPFTNVSFQCINPNNCEAYYEETKLIGTTNYNPEYSYTWNVNVFESLSGTILFYDTYTTYLTISFVDPGIPPVGAKLIPQILLTVSDGTNVASAFATLPISPSPQNGTISIYPPEGEAYTTTFFVSTSGWVDNDLPLSFQFFIQYTDDSNYLLKTFQPFDFVQLVPPPWQSFDWYIGVVVTDSLQIQSEVQTPLPVIRGAQSWSELLEKNHNALSASKSSTNFFQRFQLISAMLRSLIEWEIYVDNKKYLIKSADFKYAAITEMQNIFVNLNSKTEMKVLLLQNVLYTAENLLWNQDRNWELYMDVLDSNLQINSSTLLITRVESEMLPVVLDNLLSSMIRPGNTIQNPDRIYAYVNTLIRSMVIGPIPPYGRMIYYGDFFTAETRKMTYCQLLEEGITQIFYGSDLNANFTLKPGKTIQPEQCNHLVDFIFLAFRRNYTVDWSLETKTIIYMDLRDSITGESLLTDLFDFFLLSKIFICPDDFLCVPTGDGGTTIYGVFDLKDQIMKIFAKSNIDQIGNFSVLQDFKFWKSVAFWTVLGFSIWFLLSFHWLYAKHPTYCALQGNRNINQKSLFKKINLFFWVVHPLIGIYIYNDSKITKPTKLIIYYQSLIVVMVFSTIFSSIEKGEGYVFKGYILLFNSVTVTPINAIFGRAFEWISKIKNPKKQIGPRIKFFLAFLVYLLILAASFVVMFVIEAQQDQSQNLSWAINFLISFIQDFTLSPLISVVNKILLLRLSQTVFVRNRKRAQKIVAFFLPQSFKSIYKSIFIVRTAMPIPPTTPTTIPDPLLTLPMSPPSSSRRLYRFGTLETASPSKSRTPYDFRSRRASETEMNTADIMAMETLMSNRFQTLFSEAKAESVKTMSPMIKENFTKMQSSNLYSSRSSSKFPTGRNSKTPEKKLVNLTSIVFSPETENVDSDASPAPEEDVISFDDHPQDTYASSPKTWKGGNTLRNFLSKQKTKKNDSSPRCKTVT